MHSQLQVALLIATCGGTEVLKLMCLQVSADRRIVHFCKFRKTFFAGLCTTSLTVIHTCVSVMQVSYELGMT